MASPYKGYKYTSLEEAQEANRTRARLNWQMKQNLKKEQKAKELVNAYLKTLPYEQLMNLPNVVQPVYQYQPQPQGQAQFQFQPRAQTQT